MPSLTEAIQSASGLLSSGYVESVPVEQSPGAPTSAADYDPGRNSMIRCPLPPLWQDSSDSQRQFYIDNKVPQMRVMTPQSASVSGGTSGSSGSVIIEGGSGGSGGGGSSTATIAAAQAVVTTPVLPSNAKFVGGLAVSKSFQLLGIAVSSACRVQFYGTASAQTQDAGRGLDVPLPAGVMQNIIADVVLDSSPFQWSFQDRIGANADHPQQAVMYVTITNLAAASSPVTLTLQYVPIENV